MFLKLHLDQKPLWINTDLLACFGHSLRENTRKTWYLLAGSDADGYVDETPEQIVDALGKQRTLLSTAFSPNSADRETFLCVNECAEVTP